MRHSSDPAAGSVAAFALSTRELVLLALVLVVPVPLFAATGLSIPLPAIVERVAGSLVFGNDRELEPLARASIRRAPGERAEAAQVAGGFFAAVGVRPSSDPTPSAAAAARSPASPVRHSDAAGARDGGDGVAAPADAPAAGVGPVAAPGGGTQVDSGGGSSGSGSSESGSPAGGSSDSGSAGSGPSGSGSSDDSSVSAGVDTSAGSAGIDVSSGSSGSGSGSGDTTVSAEAESGDTTVGVEVGLPVGADPPTLPGGSGQD